MLLSNARRYQEIRNLARQRKLDSTAPESEQRIMAPRANHNLRSRCGVQSSLVWWGFTDLKILTWDTGSRRHFVRIREGKNTREMQAIVS